MLCRMACAWQLFQKQEKLIVCDGLPVLGCVTDGEFVESAVAVKSLKLAVAMFHFEEHDLSAYFILSAANMVDGKREQFCPGNDVAIRVEVLAELRNKPYLIVNRP